MSPSIFVSIANYRDAQVRPTVDDLLAKAAHPERIRIGVLSQIDPVTENHLQGYTLPQVREQIVPYQSSFGVCWARARILDNLMGDEDYVLQIDSHSRFLPGWDQVALSMFERHGDPKAVLTHYPVDFQPDAPLPPQAYTYQQIKKFNDNGLPVISSGTKALSLAPPVLQPNAVVAGGCLFTRTSTLREVRYDPYLYFTGEEISLAVRLFTHGYNLYTPNTPFLWHQYAVKKVDRIKHWEDHRDWGQINKRALQRLKHLLGIAVCTDPQAMTDWHLYGLGNERTLRQWEAFAGINIKDRTFTPKSESGNFGFD